MDVLLLYVCPFLGGLLSTAMYAAPINDMRTALERGTLGDLVPFPFAMMTGNTFGWLIYAYMVWDPFLIAANLPGLILSIWLNMGAAKLQYMEKQKRQRSVAERNQIMQRWDADRVAEDRGDSNLRRRQASQQEEDGIINEAELVASLQMTSQESLLLRVITFWAGVLVYTTWLYPAHSNPANLIGILVNINLVVFFAAPLKSIRTVIEQRNSNSIHFETMVMNWVNTSFWIAYGCARKDLVIALPNATGLMLGVIQGVLCMIYPRQSEAETMLVTNELETDFILYPNNDHDEDNTEEPVPATPSPSRLLAANGKNQVQETPGII